MPNWTLWATAATAIAATLTAMHHLGRGLSWLGQKFSNIVTAEISRQLAASEGQIADRVLTGMVAHPEFHHAIKHAISDLCPDPNCRMKAKMAAAAGD